MKDELPEFATADNRSDTDHAIAGWVRRFCAHTHPGPANGHPNPTDRYAHNSPTNCGYNRSEC
jgi:hypothetical protein